MAENLDKTSSPLPAELQDKIIVRDFAIINAANKEQTPPHRDASLQHSLTKGVAPCEEDKPIPSIVSSTGQNTTDSEHTANRHVKLPYTRYYSPKWTSQYQSNHAQFDDGDLPRPYTQDLSDKRINAVRYDREVKRRHSSATSDASQYSTMPQHGHTSSAESRAKRSHRSSRHKTRGSQNSTDRSSLLE